MDSEERQELAIKLMDDFARRTGISSGGEDNQRYLWTDAFAVQAFFGLYHLTGEEDQLKRALKLIDLVHNTLGKFRPDDPREGWISGLSEKEGKSHPTIGGLRIGKKMAERKAGETFNARLEWERDGQYFHYLTRWMSALLQAQIETNEEKYALWAAELAGVAGKFIDDERGEKRMYWKMSTDLSRPLVDSMGAHDPLEGAIMAQLAKTYSVKHAGDLDNVIHKLENICIGRDWVTSDPLGIGGLLLNVPRSSALDQNDLPAELQADKLFRDALQGLRNYNNRYDPKNPAHQRLAFRECGLTLGCRVVDGLIDDGSIPKKGIEEQMDLVAHLENFWSKKESRGSASWLDHLDINAVTLASSLIANDYPEAFAGKKA